MARSWPGETAASTFGGTFVVMQSRGVWEISSGLFGGACAAPTGAGTSEQIPKIATVRRARDRERIRICKSLS
jgi:hypothetical protein